MGPHLPTFFLHQTAIDRLSWEKVLTLGSATLHGGQSELV